MSNATNMRALLTSERYAPAVGGAERVIQRVAEGLMAGGHEVTVVTGGKRSSKIINGVRIERFPVRGNAANGIKGPVDDAISWIAEAEIDVLLNYAAQTWTTDACLG